MKFVADENFNGPLFAALSKALPPGALARVQELGLSGADDPMILQWAADHQSIVLTHDEATFKDFAYSRVGVGLSMPGVFIVKQSARLTEIVEEIMILHQCSDPKEWEDLVTYIPF
jgi:predicted nuclease of predicted toxin-antitoxin system